MFGIAAALGGALVGGLLANKGRGGGGAENFNVPEPPKPRLGKYINPITGYETEQYELPDGRIVTEVRKTNLTPEQQQIVKRNQQEYYKALNVLMDQNVLGKITNLDEADAEFINTMVSIGEESADALKKVGGFENLQQNLDYIKRYTTDVIDENYDRQLEKLNNRLAGQGIKNSSYANSMREALETARAEAQNQNRYNLIQNENQLAQQKLQTELGYVGAEEMARDKQREVAELKHKGALGNVFNPMERVQQYADTIHKPIEYEHQLALSSDLTGNASAGASLYNKYEQTAYQNLLYRQRLAQLQPPPTVPWYEKLFNTGFINPIGKATGLASTEFVYNKLTGGKEYPLIWEKLYK